MSFSAMQGSRSPSRSPSQSQSISAQSSPEESTAGQLGADRGMVSPFNTADQQHQAESGVAGPAGAASTAGTAGPAGLAGPAGPAGTAGLANNRASRQDSAEQDKLKDADAMITDQSSSQQQQLQIETGQGSAELKPVLSGKRRPDDSFAESDTPLKRQDVEQPPQAGWSPAIHFSASALHSLACQKQSNDFEM